MKKRKVKMVLKLIQMFCDFSLPNFNTFNPEDFQIYGLNVI